MIRTTGPEPSGRETDSLQQAARRAQGPLRQQGSSPQEPSGDSSSSSSSSFSSSSPEVSFLSRDEKRRLLAQIVRVNALDCLDDSGAFDVARARRVLPPGAVRSLVIRETTRTDREGNTITQRRVHLRLVDPLSAMRLDDQLERREDPTHPLSRAAFNELRRRTMAEDDAKALQRQRLEQMQEDKEYRRKEAEERARQLKELRQAAHDSSDSSGARTTAVGCPKGEGEPSQTEGGLSSSPQGDSLKLGVHPAASRQPITSAKPAPPQAPQTISHLKDEAQAQSDAEKREAELRKREVEYARNNMGSAAFAAWLRKRQSAPAENHSQTRNPSQPSNSPSNLPTSRAERDRQPRLPAGRGGTRVNNETTKYQKTATPERAPPPLHPMDFRMQGREKIIY